MASEFNLNNIMHASHCMRCLHALPGAWAEADTSRLAIGFYCMGSLDVMGLLDTKASAADREDWREWIWAQQTSWGDAAGFRPSPYMALPCEADDSTADLHDPPHLIMTYTALLCLAILRDDFSRLNRRGLINLLRRTQQDDGSFSSTPGHGESDMRLVYTACAISHMLNDWSGINTDKAIAYIKSCRTYEGGYGQACFCEAQGGPTYCAIAALHLLPAQYASSSHLTPAERGQTLRWLNQNQSVEGGFKGRTEKSADACYSFWCGAALHILGGAAQVDKASNADFLHRCQFRYGGIAKAPDAHADPYHTYLSLAALALYPPEDANESWSLSRLDPLLNATEETAKWARENLGNRELASLP